jgi:hypothetical protein
MLDSVRRYQLTGPGPQRGEGSHDDRQHDPRPRYLDRAGGWLAGWDIHVQAVTNVVPHVRVFAALHPLSTDNSQVMTITTYVGCSVIEQVALAQLVID